MIWVTLMNLGEDIGVLGCGQQRAVEIARANAEEGEVPVTLEWI